MATALTGDLIDHVDSTYRTRARRDGRAIAGLSMGGFGALHLAFAAPDVFAAAASLSGALFVGRPEGVSIDDLFGDVFGEPFELARYRAASPLGRAGELEGPSELPEIYLTSGDDDFFGFFEGAALLFLQLREVGARAELRISDGDHDWAYWRAALDPALRFLTARLRSAGDNVLEQPGGR
jgi:S-formylglutathione hydrolase FrmB